VHTLDSNTRHRIKRRLAWVASEEYKNAVEARKRLREVLPQLLMLLHDSEFIDLLHAVGVESIPRLPRQQSEAWEQESNQGKRISELGHDTLSFLVGWVFVTKVRSNSIVAAYLQAKRHNLMSDLEATASTLRRHGFFLSPSRQ